MEVNQENASQESVQTDSQAQASEAAQAPQVTELDGLSEFTFQGEKYNPEQFHKILSDYKNYSQQSKEWEAEKKFTENLQIDLDNVLQRPELAQKFKEIYPQKYHAVLDKFLKTNGQTQAQNQPAQPSLPKEFLNEFQQMKQQIALQNQRAYDAEVQSANAKLDAILPPLLAKYELANTDQVYTRAERLLEQGQKLTDKTWERLVRESHEAVQKKADQVYSAKLKKQQEVGQRGQDVGAGGATPGQAPKKPRTFDEAQTEMIAWAKAQRG